MSILQFCIHHSSIFFADLQNFSGCHMCMASTFTRSPLWIMDIPTRAMLYAALLLPAVLMSHVYGLNVHCCHCIWFIKCIPRLWTVTRLWTVARFWQVTIGRDWSYLLTNYLPTPCSVVLGDGRKWSQISRRTVDGYTVLFLYTFFAVCLNLYLFW